jgi:hypothetical protein
MQCNLGTVHVYHMKIFEHICTCKAILYIYICVCVCVCVCVCMYMYVFCVCVSNIIIEKQHQCNCSFGYQSQQIPYTLSANMRASAYQYIYSLKKNSFWNLIPKRHCFI